MIKRKPRLVKSKIDGTTYDWVELYDYRGDLWHFQISSSNVRFILIKDHETYSKMPLVDVTKNITILDSMVGKTNRKLIYEYLKHQKLI